MHDQEYKREMIGVPAARLAMAALLLAAAAPLTGCATVRAASAKTPDEIEGFSVCLSREEVRKKIGREDRTINVPGGGYIHVHNVLLRSAEYTPNALSQGALAVLSFGITELTYGTSDLMQCETGGRTGGGMPQGRCAYAKLRYWIHYTAEGRPICWESRQLRNGAFRRRSDATICPVEYKNALTSLIDTKDLPASTVKASEDPSFASAPPDVMGNLIADVAEEECAKRTK